MASQHRRKKGDQFCPKHQKKELSFSCDDCDDTPVCSLCITTDHKGHKLTDIDSLTQSKFNFIQDFNNDIKTQIIPKIENNLQHAEVSMGTFEQSIVAEIDRVEGQRNYLKKKIDTVSDKNISDLKDILKKYQTLIQQFRTTTKISKEEMQNLISNNCEALKSNQNIFVIDVAEELKAIKYEPKTFEDIPTVEYQPGTKSDCDRLIEEAFGHIETMNVAGDPIGTHALKASNKLSRKIKTLLQKPSLLNNRSLSFIPKAVDITTDGTIDLFAFYDSNVLHLLDTNGEMRECTLDSIILDIAVHPVSDDVYCTMTDNSVSIVDRILFVLGLTSLSTHFRSYQDNSVRIVDRSTGRTTQLFVPEGKPYALAFMNDGTMLVGDYDKALVTLYSSEFKKKRTFTYKGKEPRQIAVCRTTGRIAIACWYSDVLVIDSNFTEFYRYAGPPGDQGLISSDVVFDGFGHLLVADPRENKGVHILNGENGQHIQTLTTDSMGWSQCLTINHDGHVVVGTHNPNQLLLFKYLD